MRRLIIVLSIAVLTVALCGHITSKNSLEYRMGKIYYTDHSMLRLIPVDLDLGKTSIERAARLMLDKLIEGQDENSKILRVIPNEKACMSVKVRERTAVVNLKSNFIKNKPANKVHGLLAVYSIVNSLTSINGIDTVQFMIENESEKGFVDGLDMREVFIPDYYI